jgi:hypothetical protein
VGNDEDPVTEVRGTNGDSRYAIPFRVIPERGKVLNDSDSPVSKEPWNVLSEDVAGSKYANGTGELGPEPASVVFAFALAGVADGLAGEASADEVNSTR